MPQFEQLEAERFDLRKDAEQGGPVFKQAGEHRLAAPHLRDHRGKGREGGSSEAAAYPDLVQARQCGHRIIVPPGLVSRRRRNLVILQSTG